MNYELLNAVGLPCPLPVVQAKKALERPDVDNVQIKVDNFTGVQNLQKMAAGLGFGFEFDKISDSEFDVILGKHGHDTEHGIGHDVGLDLHEPDMAMRDSTFVVAIGSDIMGRGSDELGKVLMKSFIYSLTELDTFPEAVLFFNSGAFLTSDGSSAIGDLQTLIGAGTNVLTCGACVDYYKLPQPIVGEITNMFEIAGIMTKTQRLISL